MYQVKILFSCKNCALLLQYFFSLDIDHGIRGEITLALEFVYSTDRLTTFTIKSSLNYFSSSYLSGVPLSSPAMLDLNYKHMCLISITNSQEYIMRCSHCSFLTSHLRLDISSYIFLVSMPSPFRFFRYFPIPSKPVLLLPSTSKTFLCIYST